ncbi:MAG: DUF177 domain-containing protein [Pseudomonadota bacterium]
MTRSNEPHAGAAEPHDLTPLAPRTVSVGSLPRTGRHVVMTLTDAETKAIEESFDLAEIKAFEARLLVERLEKDTVRVTGTLSADVVHHCVVSLEPVPQKVTEEVDVKLVPETTGDQFMTDEDGALIITLDEDVPDTYRGGTVDVGALALEFLALGLDPYPHAPDVTFTPEQENDGAGSPFAKLIAIKDKLKPN